MKIFCIYTKQIEKSVSSANECVKTGKKFGYSIELYESIYWKDVEKVATKENLKMRYLPSKNETLTKTHAPATRIANGLTHYELYKHCVNTNKSLCILEHDSRIVNNFPEPIRDGVIQVSSHIMENLTEEKIFKCGRANKMRKRKESFRSDWSNERGVHKHPLNGTNGTSGYIIGPEAAQKMLEMIQKTGVAFADRIRTEYIGEGNLYIQNPQSVWCDHNQIRSARNMG